MKNGEATEKRAIAIGKKVGSSWFPRREAYHAAAGGRRVCQGAEEVKGLSCAVVSTGGDGYGNPRLALRHRHCPRLSGTCTVGQEQAIAAWVRRW